MVIRIRILRHDGAAAAAASLNSYPQGFCKLSARFPGPNRRRRMSPLAATLRFGMIAGKIRDEMVKRTSDLAIVGAGPYGLSLAATLAAEGHDLRIFGRPMQTWAEAMPAGMALKSDGFASNLQAPDPEATLGAYCRRQGIAYHDTELPVALDTFLGYGRDFQRRHVPGLEPHDIRAIQREGTGFRLIAQTGESFAARRVALAVGVTHFRVVPRELEGLPAALASHAADHHDLSGFAGQRVAVLGAGSSATDLAAALIDAGAQVTLVARAGRIRFSSGPASGPRSLRQRLRHPSSPLGPGWRSRLASDFPLLFRQLPARWRLAILHRHLGPRSPWYLRDKVTAGAEILTGHRIERATAAAGTGELRLTLRAGGEGSSGGGNGDGGNGDGGTLRDLAVDHLIAATGYWPQVEQLRFLDAGLRGAIRQVAGVPELSADFESSVPGLYMTGLAAAGSFGPLMRFVAGAEFTARRLRRHLRGQGTADPLTGLARAE